ncbi:MAG: topoisomerase C-terminal repeat-containing protein, partial [Clostridia bacterium]|nr:topoisomerase C-terminal repeat-containing protein [Clostridia bacterium]
IETLNNYLKNPFKDDKARAKELLDGGEIDDAEDYKAIFEGLELGTEATRTGIIDNARKSGYIDLKRDVYTVLPGGENLIESLERLSINMDKYKTSELGRALKGVFRGQMSVDEAVELAKSEISEVFTATDAPRPVSADTGKYGQIAGKCPLCGRNVVRGQKSYGCIGYADGCEFRIGVNICRRDIPINEVSRLLAEGATARLDGFISKNRKRFAARLVLQDGKAVFSFDK